MPFIGSTPLTFKNTNLLLQTDGEKIARSTSLVWIGPQLYIHGRTDAESQVSSSSLLHMVMLPLCCYMLVFLMGNLMCVFPCLLAPHPQLQQGGCRLFFNPSEDHSKNTGPQIKMQNGSFASCPCLQKSGRATVPSYSCSSACQK